MFFFIWSSCLSSTFEKNSRIPDYRLLPLGSTVFQVVYLGSSFNTIWWVMNFRCQVPPTCFLSHLSSVRWLTDLNDRFSCTSANQWNHTLSNWYQMVHSLTFTSWKCKKTTSEVSKTHMSCFSIVRRCKSLEDEFMNITFTCLI